jgi:predicted CXXCH cytochrome family protein
MNRLLMETDCLMHPKHWLVIAFLLASGVFLGSSRAAEKGAESCLAGGCHRAVKGGKFVHGIIGDGACDGCHQPAEKSTPYRSGKEHKFQKIDVAANCGECHSFDEGKKHGPVADGDCLACHNPHSAPRAELLAKPYPASWYALPSAEEYALCFECHDGSALAERETEKATEFRNGRMNLHWLHVLGQTRGRSCTTCHEVHTSGQAHFIAKTVSFFGYKVPVNFEATETGGRCTPACHETKTYERSPKPETKAKDKK